MSIFWSRASIALVGTCVLVGCGGSGDSGSTPDVRPATFRARNATSSQVTFFVESTPSGVAGPRFTLDAGDVTADQTNQTPGTYLFKASIQTSNAVIAVERTLTLAPGSDETIRVFRDANGLELGLE